MFTILTPALATPIILTLAYGMRDHKKQVSEAPVAVQRPQTSFATKFMNVFWSLDVVGLILLVGGAGMVLVTVTLANGRGSKWSDGSSGFSFLPRASFRS
jgi:SIT family siderophore-iron:H+ symporter-like MFS transporter